MTGKGARGAGGPWFVLPPRQQGRPSPGQQTARQQHNRKVAKYRTTLQENQRKLKLLVAQVEELLHVVRTELEATERELRLCS